MARARRSKNQAPGFNSQPQGRLISLSGVYLGVVKDNRDSSKNGRLKVWIPELGGDPSDASTWMIVSYASPFAGATPFAFTGTDPTRYEQTESSYGFWFVPPDVDNEVLVMFLNGDSTRGVWFACMYQNFMNSNVPGYAAAEPGLLHNAALGEDIELPAGEYNKNIADGRNFTTPDDELRPANPYRSAGLRDQGLIYDNVRGVNESSARRESPSQVYGINTPGPRVTVGAESTIYRSDNETARPQRIGGHSFVMDDGETEFIHLKTRSGSQIRIDETNGIVYINNRAGTAWIEMSESGHIDFYGANSISVRSELDVNIRADRDLNLESGRNINIKSAKDYVSKQDRIDILSKYANTQQKTIDQLFTQEQKRSYITDNPSLKIRMDRGDNVDTLFVTALTLNGYPTRGRPDLRFEPSQEAASTSTLQSIDLLHLLRDSTIIGEKFGTGGNLSIQANADMNLYAEQNISITAAENDLAMFAGNQAKLTSGNDFSIISGEDLKLSSGAMLDLLSGTDFRQFAGGNLELSVMTDLNATLRGNTSLLLEGLQFNIEARPTQFSGSGRTSLPVTSHTSRIQLGNLTIESRELEMLVEGGGITTSAPSGDIRTYGRTIRQDALISIHSQAPNLSGNETSGIAIPVNIVSLGLTLAQRAQVGTVATLADTPAVLAKSNVLPVIKRVGNKEFALTFHRQEVESIVSRLITREPCVEHENTAGSERNADVAAHLRFRKLD